MQLIIKIITIGVLISALTACKSGHMTQDDRQTSEQAMNDQTTSRPRSETAKINVQLGIAYLEQKNVQRAKQKLLLALEQGPDIPETWYSMAYFLEATGNSPEARKYYLKSVEIAPLRGDAHNNYGTFLCRAGQYQESIKHFMLAVNAPDYLDPASAYENAGLCSMKHTAYKQAATYFQQALLKDPTRHYSLLKLAEANLKLHRYSEARQVLTEFALVTEPTPEYRNLRDQLVKATG